MVPLLAFSSCSLGQLCPDAATCCHCELLVGLCNVRSRPRCLSGCDLRELASKHAASWCSRCVSSERRREPCRRGREGGESVALKLLVFVDGGDCGCMTAWGRDRRRLCTEICHKSRTLGSPKDNSSYDTHDELLRSNTNRRNEHAQSRRPLSESDEGRTVGLY
jgi:hypothetical protein